MYLDVGRGFSAWVEMWEARGRARGRLYRVANRLRVPGMAFAYRAWREDWRRGERAAEAKARATHSSAQLPRAQYTAPCAICAQYTAPRAIRVPSAPH